MTATADMPVDTLLALYPALGGIAPADFASVLADETRLLQVPAGTLLFSEGKPCSGFPMLLSGGVRVARGSPGGRSLELYHVGPGELCVVSTACLFGQVPLSAHGVAETDTELLHLSPAGFARWVAHEPFRRFVFSVFADRLAELMALAEAVAFLGDAELALGRSAAARQAFEQARERSLEIDDPEQHDASAGLAPAWRWPTGAPHGHPQQHPRRRPRWRRKAHCRPCSRCWTTWPPAARWTAPSTPA